MPTLPKDPFTLTGGCFCQAIRYTISIPELSARPKLPDAPDDETIGQRNETTERQPQTEIDHCSMCRRIQGSVVLVWMSFLRSWVEFSLLTRDPDGQSRITPLTLDVLTGSDEVIKKTFVTVFSSSEKVHRVFCAKCGTHVTFHITRPNGTPDERQSVDITYGSLDPEFLEWDALKPTDKAYEDSGIGWVRKWLKDGERSLVE